jgi:hypothetical protein
VVEEVGEEREGGFADEFCSASCRGGERGSKDRGSVGGEREWHESVFFEAGHGIEVSKL